MLKKIMAGREKGKRRWFYNENLPKVENIQRIGSSKGQGKESNRRITVLNKLFMKNITDLMATDSFAKSILGYGIQVREKINCAIGVLLINRNISGDVGESFARF